MPGKAVASVSGRAGRIHIGGGLVDDHFFPSALVKGQVGPCQPARRRRLEHFHNFCSFFIGFGSE
jgi:hypothetical protein